MPRNPVACPKIGLLATDTKLRARGCSRAERIDPETEALSGTNVLEIAGEQDACKVQPMPDGRTADGRLHIYEVAPE